VVFSNSFLERNRADPLEARDLAGQGVESHVERGRRRGSMSPMVGSVVNAGQDVDSRSPNMGGGHGEGWPQKAGGHGEGSRRTNVESRVLAGHAVGPEGSEKGLLEEVMDQLYDRPRKGSIRELSC
jgi:hypothetical protein